jgi:alpha-galactosidase
MSASVYALGVAESGTGLAHLHWGAPVSLDELASHPRPTQPVRDAATLTWGDEEPLEYVPFGGRRFDEPSLKVEYPDGTRAIEWHFAGHRCERDGDAITLEVELKDDAYPLSVQLFYRIFDGEDVIERWARVTNTRDLGPVILRQAFSADWWLRPGEQWRLRYLHGGWGRETQIVETALVPGKIVLESRRGTTSHQLSPWFALGAADATSEEHGEVWSGAVAWSGSWKMVLETTPSGRAHVCGGWNDFDSPIGLAGGADVVLPVFAGCYSPAGFGGSSRAWHGYQRRHVLANEGRSGGSPSFPRRSRRGPAPAAPEVRPVLYNSWEATTFSVNEQDQLRLAELAAGIGVETFVLDDGWFRGRADDRAGLGDWYVDEHKFPRGLGPLVDGVHRLGLGFGFWVEPEMVNPDSDLYRAHPDWVYHFAHRSRSEARHQLVLNLARPDVAEWLYTTLDRLLSEHAVDFVKWDMNRHFSEPGWPALAGDNPERIWTGHVRNLYDILDRLRSAHPGVAFESCSGGGGRVDLGILSRVEQAWTSDNTDAWDRVAIQEGFSQVYSPMAMMDWVTDSPNPLTGRRLSLRYRFHVAMSGSLGIGADLRRWSASELDEARELVAKYKSLRHIVQLGRLHRLASTRTGPLGAVEYLSEAGDEAVVLAYWGARHYGPHPARLRLAALEPEARYRDVATGDERGGAELMRLGAELEGPLDFGSTLVHLVRQPSVTSTS